MIDKAPAWEAYATMEIDDIDCLKITDNIADPFAKIVDNKGLNTLLDDGQITTTVSHWIIQSEQQSAKGLSRQKHSNHSLQSNYKVSH